MINLHLIYRSVSVAIYLVPKVKAKIFQMPGRFTFKIICNSNKNRVTDR